MHPATKLAISRSSLGARPNAPDLLTLVTDTESIVSSIDTLTSYLDSELAPSTTAGEKRGVVG